MEVVAQPTNFTADQVKSVIDAAESVKEVVNATPQPGVTVEEAQPTVTDNLKIYNSNITVQEGLLPIKMYLQML